jgi:hypothetical protein
MPTTYSMICRNALSSQPRYRLFLSGVDLPSCDRDMIMSSHFALFAIGASGPHPFSLSLIDMLLNHSLRHSP